MPTAASPRTRRLYELPAAFAALEAAIDEADGELSPELEAALEALEGTLEQKADGIAALVRQADAEAAGYREERRLFEAKERAAGNRADRLKAYLLGTLTALGRDRVQGERFTVRTQKNSVPTIRWERPLDELPPAFLRITVAVDGEKARATLKAGGKLPDGFAAEVGRHLRIV